MQKITNSIQTVSILSFTVFLFVFAYYFHQGLNTTPCQIKESDSLAYHIPLAQSFAKGEFLNFPNINRGIGYYPGVGELILSLFIKLNIPLNLFNVLALVILFVLLAKVARSYNLGKEVSLIFASSVCLLPPVIREINTQMVDIWLAIFFVWSLISLKNLKKSNRHFLLLGSSLGLLAGTKYVGIPLTGFLILTYLKDIYKYLNTKRFFLAFVPFSVFGLSWIIRNYLLKGNPFYPSALFDFPSNPDFGGTMWQSNLSVFLKAGNFKLLIDSTTSELGIWSVLLVIFSLSVFKFRKKFSKDFTRLLVAGLLALLLFFPQPFVPILQSTMSKFRFIIPGLSAIFLGVFLLAKKKDQLESLCALAFLNSLIFLPQLTYQPKLYILVLIISYLTFFKRKMSTPGVS